MDRAQPAQALAPSVLAKIEQDLAQTRADPLDGFDAERVLLRIEAAASATPRIAAKPSSWSPRRHVWLFAAAFAALASAAVLVSWEQLAEPAKSSKNADPSAPSVGSAHVLQRDLPRAAEPVELQEPRPSAPRVSASAGKVDVKADGSKLRLEQELRQLALVRQALTSDPAGALSLADAGHREFKGGVMHEEREALAVMALSRLGARAAFETRARRFLKSYPKSGFRERIVALLPERTQPAP